MNESNVLLEALVTAVAHMRDLQKMIHPGTPRAIREAVAAAEAEVDAQVTLLQLPELPFTELPEVPQ